MGKELGRIREMIELPFKYPAIFQHLGIEPPKGVLLCGPPGTGKMLKPARPAGLPLPIAGCSIKATPPADGSAPG